MIDFISSIDNGYQRIAVDSDPSSRLKTRSDRVYDYDEAIADLNKAAKLLPDFAYIYYNRGNLLCLSGRMARGDRGLYASDRAESVVPRGLL